MIKKTIVASLVMGMMTFSSFADHHQNHDEALMKEHSVKLCKALKAQDKAGFEAMLDESQKGQMRWWWEASGKGKYFTKLYSKCEFDHVDKRFSEVGKKYKVFIQRFNLDGTKWSRPAPVVFKKNAKGEWKITSYSL